jgi:hypothetical protein
VQFTGVLNEAGIPFGYPEYHSGQQIVVHAQFQTSSQWVFFKPFTWQVWVFIVGAGKAAPSLGGLCRLPRMFKSSLKNTYRRSTPDLVKASPLDRMKLFVNSEK